MPVDDSYKHGDRVRIVSPPAAHGHHRDKEAVFQYYVYGGTDIIVRTVEGDVPVILSPDCLELVG